MKAVQRKLQDRSGATLTVALLFFIMCAATGSVILAAATTSTGRLAELQASDQNYYAVVSAAKLLRDEIDGQTISVGQKETKIVTTTRTEKTEKDANGADVTVVEETTKTEYSYSAPKFEHLKDTTAGAGITSATEFSKFSDTLDKFYLLDALKNTFSIDSKEQKRTGALTTVDYMKGVSGTYNGKKNIVGTVSETDYSAANDVFTSALMNGTENIYTDTFTMTAALDGFTLPVSAASTLPVDVRIVMNGQGNIKAYIKNHLDASVKKQGNEYRLMLTLDAKEGAVQSDSSNGTSEDGSESPTTTKDGGTTTSTESSSVTRHSYVTWETRRSRRIRVKMSGKLKNKLKSKKGETITETLVSVLIAAAAMILFASMITSSQRILQKSESIMNAYYAGETNMEEAMADGGTAGGSKTGAAVDTGGAGEAKTGGSAEAGGAKNSGTTDGGIKTGIGMVTIQQANNTLPRYNISYKHTNGQIDVTYATNQPNGTSTSGIERFAVAEYKSKN